MRQVFSKAALRALSSLVAAAILLGSLSLSSGVVVVSGPNHPELTVNICQPLKASYATTSTLLARPAPAVEAGFVLRDFGSAAIRVLTRPSAEPRSPDTPPPKQFI